MEAGRSRRGIRIDETPDETIVHLPVQRGILRALGQVFMLGFWSLGGMLAFILVATGAAAPFFAVFLVGWAIGFVALVLRLLWTLLGRDTLIARPDGLVRKRSILFWGPRETFTARQARLLTYIENDPSRRVHVNNRTIAQPALEIAGDGRLARFGHGISKSDAEAVIAAVRARVGTEGAP